MTFDGAVRSAALRWSALYAGLLALVALLMVRSDGRTPDDAYIFFRYAQHLAQGEGWVYNLGESTSNGATSPLWTVLLALVYLIRPRMESNAWALYAACLAGAALLTAVGLRRCGRPLAGAVAAVALVVNPVLLLVRGMESALLLLLLAAVLVVGVQTSSSWCLGVLSGLLVLVRPEGAVVVGLVLVLRWRRDGAVPWRPVVAAAAVLAPWVVFSLIEWGSPIAGTLAAKTAQGRSGFFGPPFVFVRYLRSMVVQPWSLVLMLLAVPGLWVGLRRPATRTFVAVAVSFAAVQFLLYGLVVRPPAYLWYYAPAYWVLSLLAGLGAWWLGLATAAAVGRWVAAGGTTTRVVRLGATGVALALVVALSLHGQYRGDLYVGYEQAGRWLAANAEPDASVAAVEIGVLGWTSQRPVVDYLGLLSSTSADEVGRGDLSTWLERERPDFYVEHVPPWEHEVPSRDLASFGRNYRPVFTSDEVKWSTVRLYQRTRGP